MVRSEILETPSIKPDQGIWTSYGSTRIQASVIDVWKALRDFESWKKWNQYTPQVDTPRGGNDVQVGDVVTIHYRADTTSNITPIPCRAMTISDDNMELCWRGEVAGVPTWLLLPEKVQRVTEVSAGECLYEIFETQSGPMAYLVKWMMGAKQSAMNQGIADALKVYVEGGRASN